MEEHAGDLVGAGAEAALHMWQRHVGNGGIQHLHDGGQHVLPVTIGSLPRVGFTGLRRRPGRWWVRRPASCLLRRRGGSVYPTSALTRRAGRVICRQQAQSGHSLHRLTQLPLAFWAGISANSRRRWPD